ncbi:MAG: hypothetical protein IMW89_07595 [Ktedonobacteraceae bacterium]|nr:hypothetical protein [Ktedonobacteraceae bacterium]
MKAHIFIDLVEGEPDVYAVQEQLVARPESPQHPCIPFAVVGFYFRLARVIWSGAGSTSSSSA